MDQREEENFIRERRNQRRSLWEFMKIFWKSLDFYEITLR